MCTCWLLSWGLRSADTFGTTSMRYLGVKVSITVRLWGVPTLLAVPSRFLGGRARIIFFCRAGRHTGRTNPIFLMARASDDKMPRKMRKQFAWFSTV